MMMTLGFFVFSKDTAPYQSDNDERAWRHPGNSRVGARQSSQFLGPDEQTKTLSGVLMPAVTGGPSNLDSLQDMADTGEAYPLIDGTGRMLGLFLITGISTTKTELFRDGAARRIEFSLSLKRADSSSQMADPVSLITGMLT